MQTKSGNERMQERRRGNVLNYEGNICKQVIEALGRRLDKWRTVLLLFKRTPTCEWIFCSQKVARVSQDFHSRGRRLSLNRWGSNITIETWGSEKATNDPFRRNWEREKETYTKNRRFRFVRTRVSSWNGIWEYFTLAEWKRSTRSSYRRSVPVQRCICGQ